SGPRRLRAPARASPEPCQAPRRSALCHLPRHDAAGAGPAQAADGRRAARRVWCRRPQGRGSGRAGDRDHPDRRAMMKKTPDLSGFEWTTPFIADACVLLGIALRIGPPGLKPILPGTRVAGRARPGRHAGSVDVFLEAASEAETSDV